MRESQKNTKLFRPLFKTREEACDVGATKSETAQEIAPVVIRLMASTLVPNILQSDNGGEFLGETLKAVNR